MTRNPTEKQRNRWYWTRVKNLNLEGFTPEESIVIARTKITTSAVRRIRRQRRKMLQLVVDTGLEQTEAIKATREAINRGWGPYERMIDWEKFVRAVYPKIRVRISVKGFGQKARRAYAEAQQKERFERNLDDRMREDWMEHMRNVRIRRAAEELEKKRKREERRRGRENR